MRQVVLDSETTGIDPKKGHRIIEIGCVELIDRRLTGTHYHTYINPEREVDIGAYKIHGISNEFLKDKPVFKEIASEFLSFIKGAQLIIHNAPFDVGFINHEFNLLKNHHFSDLERYCEVIDTLVMARNKHPGQKNNLDALCKRYDVDNSNRELHGALLDSEILALVYLAMTGGQVNLFDQEQPNNEDSNRPMSQDTVKLERKHSFKVIRSTDDEIKSHQQFVEMLIQKSGVNLWES